MRQFFDELALELLHAPCAIAPPRSSGVALESVPVNLSNIVKKFL
jgi:hypothetical protein